MDQENNKIIGLAKFDPMVLAPSTLELVHVSASKIITKDATGKFNVEELVLEK